MKESLAIFIFFLTTQAAAQQFEFSPNLKDTINYIDHNGNRKGLWILRGIHKPGSCFHPQQVAETGNYSTNMKQGIWKEYHCTGQLKSEQMFVNGKVNGAVTLYYENSKIKARGTFKTDRWVDSLELFDEEGKILYILFFDSEGNRKNGISYTFKKGKKDSTFIFQNPAP